MPHLRGAGPVRGSGARSRGFRAPALLLCLAAACAAPDSEIHLAPLFSRHTAPGYDHAEAVGGVLRYGERPGRHRTWALSPLLWQRRHADGREEADFLYPLGRFEHDPERPRTYARLFPVFWREAETRPDGVAEVDWAFLPPFFWGGSSSDGQEDYFAFWPLFGTLKDFLTFDEVHFLFWPFFLSNEKGERRSTHLLWPIFGWTEGSEVGWHIFPLYGTAEVPGRYRRSYLLWPIFHRAEDELWKPEPRQAWLLVPLGGRIRQGDYTATTVLWPIFGLAERPSTGYRSFQAWPVLKFESGGREAPRRITRFLPFWTHYEDEDTEHTAFLWPVFWTRRDRFGGIERESFYAVPLYWRSETRRTLEDGSEVREYSEHLWPFARSWRDSEGREDFALPAPGMEPLLDSRILSRNLGFAFELWAGSDEGPGGVRERRAFLNLYHETESAGHRRWSVPILGGQWTEPDGTVHTSLLLGLLRWRSGPDGGLEEPAFPGPGWPDLHRLPVSESPEAFQP